MRLTYACGQGTGTAAAPATSGPARFGRVIGSRFWRYHVDDATVLARGNDRFRADSRVTSANDNDFIRSGDKLAVLPPTRTGWPTRLQSVTCDNRGQMAFERIMAVMPQHCGEQSGSSD